MVGAGGMMSTHSVVLLPSPPRPRRRFFSAVFAAFFFFLNAQGNTQEELPEVALGGVRIKYLDLPAAQPLDLPSAEAQS